MSNTDSLLPIERTLPEALTIYVDRIKLLVVLTLIGICTLGILILALPEKGYSWGIAGLLLIGVVIATGIATGMWKRYQKFYNTINDRYVVQTTLSDINDKMLLSAWRLMFQHDLKAVVARQNFSQTRSSLIIITVLSTIVAVSATFVDSDLVIYKLLAFVALSLPIVGSTYITYIQRFAKITIWLKHRVVAERIRSEIYQYRMRAGVYGISSKPDASNPDVNKEILLSASERLNMNIHTIEKELESEEAYIAVDSKRVDSKIVDRLEHENKTYPDGTIDFQDYLRIRGVDQKEWYENNIKKNYTKTKDYTSLALVIQMGGAVLTALVLVAGMDKQFIVFATVTNAISFGINSWITVEMTGQVYSIFNIARKKLSKHLGDWDALEDQIIKDQITLTDTELHTKKLEIVDAIESTLGEERENWYRLALQTLSSNDQALFQAVEDLRQDKPDKSGNGDEVDEAAG